MYILIDSTSHLCLHVGAVYSSPCTGSKTPWNSFSPVIAQYALIVVDFYRVLEAIYPDELLVCPVFLNIGSDSRRRTLIHSFSATTPREEELGYKEESRPMNPLLTRIPMGESEDIGESENTDG